MAGKITGPDFGKVVTNLTGSIQKGRVTTVSSSALKAKTVQEAALRAASGGDMVLSGANRAKGRKGGAKLGVRFKLEGGTGNPSALLAATGPVQLVENNTSGHVIRSAYASGAGRKGFIGPTAGQFGGGGRGGKAVLRIPGVGFRRSARHPGTKGKKPWANGRKAAEPVIRKSMSQQTFNIIKGAAKP